jgi:hypothetical protein
MTIGSPERSAASTARSQASQPGTSAPAFSIAAEVSW